MLESVQPIEILSEIVAIPGPPGQEQAIRDAVQIHVGRVGLQSQVDPRGNLVVHVGEGSRPRIVVTAHLDEIAMMVRAVDPDGSLRVVPLGGLYPWKLGEGPVQVLASLGPLDGILSFGSIHTSDPASVVRRAEAGPLRWEMAHVITHLTAQQLALAGVRAGTRVVVHPVRRQVFPFGGLVGSYFLDDRADLVSWLLALESLAGSGIDVLFAATASEETGGEGAQYLLHSLQPDVCIALELGPAVVDAPVRLDSSPTVWVKDSYAAMQAADGDLVADVARQARIELQFQALSGGGSDASCAAASGLCARPFTLGLPMANSHGFEVMHPGAMESLAKLTVALVRRLAG